MAGRAYIGTSGWDYPGWRKGFYAGVPRSHWLRHCAEYFTGVEVNATFYRLQTRETFARWRDQTPDDFRFAIKGNRFLTHNKKLIQPLASIKLERERASALGAKLAAVVWQLPRNLRRDLARLEAFVRGLHHWSDGRHAVEFRHSSWFDPSVAGCLEAYRVAVCQSDAADWPMWQAVTTDMVYVRLNGHTRTYASRYTDASLRKWEKRIRAWLHEGRDVHVYFNNDADGHAPYNAIRLNELVG